MESPWQRAQPPSALHSDRGQRAKVELMENRLGCTPVGCFMDWKSSEASSQARASEVWLPKWLTGDPERQLNGFVHPSTADGLMKARTWLQSLLGSLNFVLGQTVAGSSFTTSPASK